MKYFSWFWCIGALLSEYFLRGKIESRVQLGAIYEDQLTISGYIPKLLFQDDWFFTEPINGTLGHRTRMRLILYSMSRGLKSNWLCSLWMGIVRIWDHSRTPKGEQWSLEVKRFGYKGSWNQTSFLAPFVSYSKLFVYSCLLNIPNFRCLIE